MKAPKISLTNLLQHFAEDWPEGLVLLPSLLTLLAIQMPSTQPCGSRDECSKEKKNPERTGTLGCEK